MTKPTMTQPSIKKSEKALLKLSNTASSLKALAEIIKSQDLEQYHVEDHWGLGELMDLLAQQVASAESVLTSFVEAEISKRGGSKKQNQVS